MTPIIYMTSNESCVLVDELPMQTVIRFGPT